MEDKIKYISNGEKNSSPVNYNYWLKSLETTSLDPANFRYHWNLHSNIPPCINTHVGKRDLNFDKKNSCCSVIVYLLWQRYVKLKE